MNVNVTVPDSPPVTSCRKTEALTEPVLSALATDPDVPDVPIIVYRAGGVADDPNGLPPA